MLHVLFLIFLSPLESRTVVPAFFYVSCLCILESRMFTLIDSFSQTRFTITQREYLETRME